jgi:hypothetical protein
MLVLDKKMLRAQKGEGAGENWRSLNNSNLQSLYVSLLFLSVYSILSLYATAFQFI